MVKPLDLEVGDVMWHVQYGAGRWVQITKMSSWQLARESLRTICRFTIKDANTGVFDQVDIAKTDPQVEVCGGNKLVAIKNRSGNMKRYGEKCVWIGYENNTQV